MTPQTIQRKPLSMREMIFAIEDEMRKSDRQRELPVRHYFERGVYARELFIPKDTTLTGKIHKYPQISILSRGDISVWTGESVRRLKAPPAVIVAAPAGIKRVAYAHEDSVWTVIHGTDETDLDKIEAHFIAQSEDEFLAFAAQSKLKEIASCHG